jgi:heptosyltransferase I
LLIVRLSAMGDVIHTLPAVEVLRAAFPQAHIGWLIEERWAELLCAPGTSRRGLRSLERPLVDEVHLVNLKAWGKSPLSVSTVQRIATVWNDVRSARYEVVIDLQGAIRSAILARLSRARVVYGPAEPRESPASMWYTRQAIAQPRHVVEQNIAVARAFIDDQTSKNQIDPDVATKPSCGRSLPRDPQAETRIDHMLSGLGMTNFAIMNPGAGWGAKRWPADRYGDVARKLSQLGLQSIFNYGPGEDDVVKTAVAASGGTAHPMSCTLTELIALTRRACVFIGGDTGPLHLAAALQIPVVAIYGPTDPARNGPYGTRSIVLRSARSLTSHARKMSPDAGILEIDSATVFAAAQKLLSECSGCDRLSEKPK